jgi:hypothetical protein
LGLVTAQRLRELLDYDEKTGVFFWRQRTSNRVRVGDQAGAVVGGYIAIGIDGRSYQAHCLAWLYVHGEWALGILDHYDTDKKNNAISNLRPTDKVRNAQNRRKPQSNNKVGLLGVSRYRNGWKAQIKFNGKNRQIGVYETAELAHQAYVEAKRRNHEGCTI